MISPILPTMERDYTDLHTNPIVAPWDTPWATPPFSKIRTCHYAPAVELGMEKARANVEAIAANAAEPTFENTIAALETASPLLDKATGLLFNIDECHTDEELQQVVLELSPRLTRFSNELYMDQRLFARVEKVYARREELHLNLEELTLLERTYRAFVKHGALLGEAERRAFAEASEELSRLTQLFNQHVLADTNAFALRVDDADALEGMPAHAVTAAREEARERGVEGWVFTLQYPSYGPFMTYCRRRDLRREMYAQYNTRGNRGNDNDNNAIVFRIAELRLAIARLLGYDDYAQYALSDKMARNTDNVYGFMDNLLAAAMPAARRDLDEVRAYARAMGADEELECYDFMLYSEGMRRAKYDFDKELLRPYLSADRVRDGIFALYGRLYGLTFKENREVEVYHPDVRVFEVWDGRRFMGLLYLDLHPRASKRGGAWMTEFRGQHRENGEDVRPLIQVVCNFTKPAEGRPALLSFDEVETFMHEMGHAMHGMLSDVRFESIGGTNVMRDFVEMPSQVMENWCYEPEFVASFARHYETGEPMPDEYIGKIRQSMNCLSGWLCVRQLNLGYTDLAFHTLRGPAATDRVADFEGRAMHQLLPPLPGCNTSTAFTHIFAGGYAAGYYGYKWAEALDADIFSVFKQKGIFNAEVARSFRDMILSKGGSEHPADMFRRFMGRDLNPDALIERSGF